MLRRTFALPPLARLTPPPLPCTATNLTSLALLHTTHPWQERRSRKQVLAAIGAKEPTPALVALGARLGLPFNPELLRQIVTHHSFVGEVEEPNNRRLEYLGKRVLSLYVSEYVHIKYPFLPKENFSQVLAGYIGNATLANLGREVGMQHVVRWTEPTRIVHDPERTLTIACSQTAAEDQLTQSAVVGKAMASLIGALYRERGPESAKRFVHMHILSRELNVRDLIEIHNPKRYLTWLMRRQNRKEPESRLLSETGRTSVSPVFVVGVFSGEEKLGEVCLLVLDMMTYLFLTFIVCTEIHQVSAPR
ncbi:ribonuclease III domain-containing protein [Jimgerdemannia flammicorona]|uniref:Large ribosomal subunit protein mL44 n=1 Tax=Jimgerdemannia flammicorona TaxID=994334 RepID=A0A433QHU8_9FUNG|nr:ribonuclease III domain-containing protein [Jimgerdemannia flammicorona]